MRGIALTSALALGVWAGCARETKMVEINGIRLYLPEDAFSRRLGGDAGRLNAYIGVLQKETTAFFETIEKPKAKGLLIAVGVKPGGRARIWCDAADGEIPAGRLAELEEKLAGVSALAVKGGAIAFAIEFRLNGQTPAGFPEMPRAWIEAAKRSSEPLRVPDGLFKAIWPG